MSMNRRNTIWFWVFLVVLALVSYYGIVAVSTVDHCGRDAPKTWNWIPPRWECRPF